MDGFIFSPDEKSAWDRKLVWKYQSCLGWVLFFFKIYFWLCWLFTDAWARSLVLVSGDNSWLWSVGSRRAGFSCGLRGLVAPWACRISPDQGSNL